MPRQNGLPADVVGRVPRRLRVAGFDGLESVDTLRHRHENLGTANQVIGLGGEGFAHNREKTDLADRIRLARSAVA